MLQGGEPLFRETPQKLIEAESKDVLGCVGRSERCVLGLRPWDKARTEMPVFIDSAAWDEVEAFKKA